MPDATPLVVRVTVHPRNFWLLVNVTFPTPELSSLAMVLDTGAPLSALSAPALDRLTAEGLVVPDHTRRFRVHGLTIDGRAIGPLSFRVSQRVTQVGADGLLGLDFLMRYREVRFNTERLELTLIS